MNARTLIALALAIGVCGCGGTSGYSPVSGQVVVKGTAAAALAGHAIEASLTSDPTVRATGVIGEDGRFALETYRDGKYHRGAPPGQYSVRIVVVREGDGRDRPPPLAKRYQDFNTSGLALQVPTSGDVTLEVAPK